ncbi:hypothetical protein [Rhodonellum sp.]|uniref:hypothetical protein n=1 Tax=Rhodonellum sp. TaxID=2231180 RepID=UPI00271612D9|nr:hypothetical protein [Rhodonellum sp.]MDO9553475.1 hypothetical protein [Rhodonellum sp.]
MKYLLFVCSIFAIGCSPFSKIAEETKIGSEDNYVSVSNPEANFHSLTFGDFEFAVNQKQFRNLNPAKPIFRNILFYAIADQPTYDYYVLENPKNRTIVHPDYILKDTLLGNTQITVAISKNAPTSDLDFIRSKISVGKK